MKFDSIIACGDSFTRYHKTALEKTWPCLLGEHYNVPWANLAKGGCSNYEIALQPIQFQPDTHEWGNPNYLEFKKPLLIFGLTTPWRLPVFAPAEGRLSSIASILPEDLIYNPYTGVDEKMYEGTINRGIIHDWFQQIDIHAIELMHKWGQLFKDSTVLWGTIHFQWDDPGSVMTDTVKRGLEEEEGRIITLHRHVESKIGKSYCFNEITDWWPLQHCLGGDNNLHINWDDKSNLEFNPIDRHPTNEGIQLFADNLIKYIDNI